MVLFTTASQISKAKSQRQATLSKVHHSRKPHCQSRITEENHIGNDASQRQVTLETTHHSASHIGKAESQRQATLEKMNHSGKPHMKRLITVTRHIEKDESQWKATLAKTRLFLENKIWQAALLFGRQNLESCIYFRQDQSGKP